MRLYYHRVQFVKRLFRIVRLLRGYKGCPGTNMDEVPLYNHRINDKLD